jgi:hypothetical protein
MEQAPETDNAFKSQRSLWELIFISYGIISFQYDIHPSILTIQVDMKEKSKLNSAVIGAFTCELFAEKKLEVTDFCSVFGNVFDSHRNRCD